MFANDTQAVTPLEIGLIAAIFAVALIDVLASRGPNMSGEISQVNGR
jgi:Flp pilus assembly pilin Flp